MFTIENIFHTMREQILHCQFASTPNREFDGVLLYEAGKLLSPKIVYAARLTDVLSAGPSAVGCSFVCAEAAPEDAERLPQGVTLLLSTRSLNTVCNNLLQLWQHCRDLRAQYRCLSDSSEGSMQRLAEIVSQELDTTVLFLSSGFSRLAGAFHPDDESPLLRNLSENGMLASAEARDFLDGLLFLSDRGKYSEYVLPESGKHCLVCHLNIHNYTAAYMLIVLQDPEEINYYLGEAEEVSARAMELLEERSGNFTLHSPFNALVADVLARRLTGREVIDERLFQMPPRGYGSAFTLITISFENIPQDFRWTFIANQVRDIFPFSNITVDKNNLLVFAKYDYEEGTHFDYDRLNTLLQEYNAYAAIGPYARYLSALPTMYQQCVSTIRLAKKLRKRPNERIFNYEDYSVYLVIEMCGDEHFRDFHAGRYYFLCHQDLLRIARYDRENNTDYLNVLYVYLANNCKITQASRELFMHRNTMISKVEKIEQIIRKPLDDPFLQERLLFSYHVVEYVEKYLGEDIFPRSIYV